MHLIVQRLVDDGPVSDLHLAALLRVHPGECVLAPVLLDRLARLALQGYGVVLSHTRNTNATIQKQFKCHAKTPPPPTTHLLIGAILKVLASVRSARLLAVLGSNDRHQGVLQQILQLQRLHQIRVPHLGPVRNQPETKRSVRMHPQPNHTFTATTHLSTTSTSSNSL